MVKKTDPFEVFDPGVTARFLSKIKMGNTPEHLDTPCIEWIGYLDKGGYGRIFVGTKASSEQIATHRWALQFAMGGVILPSEIKACHHCDNPACVAPSHLYPGTAQDNMNDMVSRDKSVVSFGNAKVNWDIVDEIRSSNLSANALSNKFNLSLSMIYAIKNHRTWKDENRTLALLPNV